MALTKKQKEMFLTMKKATKVILLEDRKLLKELAKR